jgi:rRNA processing protein Krr1/Pno1
LYSPGRESIYWVLLRTSAWLVRGETLFLFARLQPQLTVCSIVSLVLGAQPGKVYNNLRIIASRMKERF